MKRNIGLVDKIIRLLAVIVIVGLVLAHQISGLAAVILGALALIFVITSSVGFCPLYALFKISSGKKA